MGYGQYSYTIFLTMDQQNLVWAMTMDYSTDDILIINDNCFQ